LVTEVTNDDLKRHVDEQRIRAAIDAAERGTSGAIHVSLAKHVRGSARGAAERVFQSLGYGTPGSGAVLFFVVPSRREIVVLGGEGIHSKVGDAYWQQLVAEITKRAREEDLTAALVRGIAEVGERLTRHFPRATES
jgi:uncharacterized membrane protein